MNRAERVVLAVDLGTGGPKVGFVSLDGTVLWSDHVAVATEYGPSGAATQDAGLWWEIICDATRRGLAEGGVSGERVTGVSITGQWASTVPVDAQGRPVGPCVMWMDSRGEPYSRKAFGGWLAGYRPRVVLSWLRRNGGCRPLTAMTRSGTCCTCSTATRRCSPKPAGCLSRWTT